MKPIHSYSIAEARDKLTALIREAETTTAIELTRRGKPVAVILSMDVYRRLAEPPASFSSAYARFQEQIDTADLDLGPELFEGIRDTDPGREPSW